MAADGSVPSRLHVWGVIRTGEDGRLTVNPSGVSVEAERAFKHIDEELRKFPPGPVGYVCRAPASGPIDVMDYPDSRLIAFASIDPDTGTLVWRRPAS